MTELEMFIDGLKYKIKKRTSKAAPLVLAGTIGATLLGAVGCNNKNIGNETTKPVVEKEISTEIPEIPENPVVVDEYQDAYNTIDSIENKTVAFINDGLENGFYDYGKELTEDQKREIVKMTLYSNLLVNRDEIGGVPLAIINGKRTLTDTKMREQFTKFMQIFGDQLTITTPSKKMDYNNLFMDSKKAELFTKLSDLKAKLHKANKKDDTSKYNKLVKKIIGVKKELIDLNSETNGSYIKYNLDLTSTFMALSSLYDLDRLDGNIINDKEDRTGIYNKPFNVLLADCSDELEVYSADKLRKMAKEFGIKGYENMSSEQILATIKDGNTFTGSLLNETDALSYTVYYTLEDFNSIISNTMILNANEEYYEENIIERVYSKIDWSLYKRVDAVDYINEFNYGKNNEDQTEYWEKQVGTTTTRTTDEKNVPEDKREKSTKKYNRDKKQNQDTSKYDETKKASESGDSYIAGKGAGETAGSRAAYNQQISSGKIPSTISSAPNPSGSHDADYIKGYKDGYIDGWNNYVRSAKAAYQKPTTEYKEKKNGKEEKVSDGKVETITGKQQETVTEKETEKVIEQKNDQYFEKFEGEEELIEEEVEEVEEVVVNKKLNLIATAKANLYALRNSLVNENTGVKVMTKRG